MSGARRWLLPARLPLLSCCCLRSATRGPAWSPRAPSTRRAPDRREMDLRRVRGIVLFADRLERPTHLYLGPIRLE